MSDLSGFVGENHAIIEYKRGVVNLFSIKPKHKIYTVRYVSLQQYIHVRTCTYIHTYIHTHTHGHTFVLGCHLEELEYTHPEQIN